MLKQSNTPKTRKSKIKKNFYINTTTKAKKTIKGCDYITWTISNKEFFNNPIFGDINTTNTSTKNINIEYSNFTQIQISKEYQTKQKALFSISINHNEYWLVKIARFSSWYNWDMQNSKGLYGGFDLYGGFWRLKEIGEIDYDFFDCLWLSEIKNSKITRFDYKIDYLGIKKAITKKQVVDYWFGGAYYGDKMGEFLSQNYTDKKDKYTGWTMGKKSNKTCFIRMYDKKEDVKKKNKEMLYNDYAMFQGDVWRLEFEFWNKFCGARGNITINTIHLLEKQIKEYLSMEEKTDIFQKPYKQTIDINVLGDIAKKQYVKATMSRNNTCRNSGYKLTYLLNEYWFDYMDQLQEIATHSTDENIWIFWQEIFKNKLNNKRVIQETSNI